MITRLAPTPSGYIHTGNIFNFLLNWLWARSNGGKVLLRIDDGDTERKKDKYTEDIFRVLDWLQLDWDIGPTGPDDFEKNWSQAKRAELYTSLLNELAEKNAVFGCECSRKQFECKCIEKKLSLLQSGIAWRIKTKDNSNIFFRDKVMAKVTINLANNGPFVIKRKDGITSYQVASLADDRHFTITHICRGEDLLTSTAMQLYIDNNLNSAYLSNCNFWHHPVITDALGSKLSKSAGTFGSSIIGIVKKEELMASFTRWMGWGDHQAISLKDMIGRKEFI